MLARLTRNAGPNASANAPSSGPQNSGVARPASIARGTAGSDALSIAALDAIDTVSAASAIGKTTATATPERTSGIEVRVYPNTNARLIARTTVAKLLKPSAVPTTMPVTSPAMQPTRQLSV